MPQKPGTARTPTNFFSAERLEAIDASLVGCTARFQLGFSGSPVRQLVNRWLTVGDVKIRQSVEPFEYQYTDVITTDDEVPYMFEVTRRLWSRQGQFITVAEAEFTVSEFQVADQINVARARCEAALGALTAVIDERFIDRRVGEFVRIITEDGEVPADTTNAMRPFAPGVEEVDLADLEDKSGSFSGDPVLQSALKFYARGVENRLTEVGFILLSATADMLAGGRNKLKPDDLKTALDAAGEPGRWGIARLKKVAGTRGRLIHNGMIPTAEMYELWYDLEEIVRTLLRHKMKVTSAWDVRVPMYEGPVVAPDTEFDVDPVPPWANRQS